MIVGVLAFQGDVAEHMDVLERLSVESLEVRTLGDLAKVDALIIPGGESTVIAKFLRESGVGKGIRRRALCPAPTPSPSPLRVEGDIDQTTYKVPLSRNGRGVRGESRSSEEQEKSLHVFGTCAGAIVLARKATGKNAPHTLGLIDVVIDRNAYGTQLESFETSLKVKGLKSSLDVAFIRAPKITKVGKGVEVLATYKNDPVLVRQGGVMIATFHAEVRESTALHRFFLTQCGIVG